MTEAGAPLSFRLLGLYPKKAGSALVGVAAAATLPRSLREPLLGRFAASFGVDLSEAGKPIGEYTSFLDFFTRRLKPGLRPQDPTVDGGLNSPVDGALIASGRIEAGTLLQAKGLPYRMDELLAADPLAPRFEGGAYATLYLSPRDYHRIHVPCTGRVLAVGRVEGELWPVNEASTAFTPGLYVRNRRAYWIAEGTGEDEGLDVAAVMVAATHVGGVVVDPRWLEGRSLAPRDRLSVAGLPCAPGDDLGTFELGSTVVLLVGGVRAHGFTWGRPHGPVRVGQRLGAFVP
ncbi:MAG: phosphatidylserine decarboxylase [Holophagales bacterium]|jgi:phosphatidylserine decarboxylase|nr:phosphatidylserine decarboxylase [Holophagales bacterium]